MGRLFLVKSLRCNGNEKHVNEVDVDNCLETQVIHKGVASDIPERVVLQCLECTGKVIVTREMIEGRI